MASPYNPPYNQQFNPYNPPQNQQFNPYNPPPPPYATQPGVHIGAGAQPVYYTQPQMVVIDDCHGHDRHHRSGGAGEACCLAALCACLCALCLSK
ncbi:unnamed protein product [Caenorhabditis bovis]|uniref:Cysteine-rich transmembrane CYSTM domain-containing protein n=1 Tax=Caenorhabditis bovis TaxID=2654633 RepID=A0A8S1F4F4_9PELO|nr:unnamed protein product [Caenorhabditis bovis]